MAACNIDEVRKNIINHFIKKELLVGAREVPTDKLDDFEKENIRLTNYAKENKDTNLGPLFKIVTKEIKRKDKSPSRTIYRAVINEQAVESIQNFNEANDVIFESKDINDLVGGENIFGTTIKIDKGKSLITNKIKRNYETISQALFAGDPKNMNTIDVLNNISATNIIKNKFLSELLKQLSADTTSKVIIVKNGDLKNKDTFMQYNTADNTIYVSKNKLGNVDPQIAIAKFIHEVFHERTYRALNNPVSKEEKKLVEELTRDYNYIKSKLSGFEHELSSLDEFTAGMFSNSEFESNVKKLINNTFWGKIKEFLSKLFGLKLDNYSKLLDNIFSLTNTDSNINLNTDVVLESKYRQTNDDLEVNKLEKTSNDIVKLLETFFIISQRKQSGYKNLIKETIEDIDKLRLKYKDHDDAYNTLVVAKYVRFMSQQMRSFNNRLLRDDLEFDSNLYTQMENYLSAFNLINDIQELNDYLRDNKIIKLKKHKQYNDTIKEIISLFNENRNTLNNLAKNYLIDNFSSPQYFKEDYLRFRDLYRDEAKKLYPGDKNKSKRENYVNKKLSDNREFIAEVTRDRFTYLIENTKEDISKVASQINSEKSINNPIIQILSRLLDQNELDYKNEIFPELRNMEVEYNKFMQGKNKNQSSDKLFEKFVDVSSSGVAYLKGAYSIKFMDKHHELIDNIATSLEKYGPGSKKHKEAIAAKKKWVKENTVKVGNQLVPSTKWLTDFSQFTEQERDYYEHIKNIAEQADENTMGIKSLKKRYFNVYYYRLPSIRKSVLSKVQSGEFVSSIRESIKEAFTRQVDEDMEGEVGISPEVQKAYTDLSGKEINYVPIHYRGNLELKNQSFDLSTIYAMELENSIKFKHKNEIHSDLQMFLDILKQSEYTKRVGLGGKIVTSLFSKDNTPIKIDGKDSNIVKLVETMLKNRIYDKLSANIGAKIGPADANKVMSFILSFTSHLGMSLNYFGATANFAIGSVNNMIESFAGDIITKGNIANALKMYSNNVNSLMGDIGKTTNKSLINQIMDKYNIFGDVRNLKQEFEKNNKLKSLFKGDTLQFMHNVGEHGMQSVLTLAVLDNIKILNDKGQFLNIEGKIVEDSSQAASLMDIYEINEDGALDTKLDFEYTTIDTLNTFKEGGENNVRGLIKQMILRNHGNYDSRIQSEFQRHWYGKMLMMYKKHIEIPMLNRWRGLGSALKNREDLTGNELKYNYDLGKIDEGHYVSMIRFIKYNILPNLKALKLKLIMTDYKSLDNWEKANLKRTMSEIAVMGMFIATARVLASIANDDDEALWFAAYTFRRMESDLRQFHNPNEAWRILKNPFASLRQIELITEVGETLLTPWTWVEEYEGGPYKGENKLKRKLIKLTPVLTRKDLTAKQAYNFINR